MTDSDARPETGEAPSSLVEAEEEAIRAQSRADEARARAIQLRRQAEAASGDPPDATDNAGALNSDSTSVEDGGSEAGPPSARSRRRWQLWRPRSNGPARPRKRVGVPPAGGVPPPRASAARIASRLRRPRRKTVGVSTAIVLVSASLGAAGYMEWQHLTLVHERQRAAEFTAAARHGVETLMSIDPSHAKENIQRIIDGTTGQLKSQLEATATYLVKNAQDAKVTTKATVEDVAVESITDNSAVVLVVAKSDTTNPDNTKRPPVSWRLSVDINRDGGQLKMSKTEFVQ